MMDKTNNEKMILYIDMDGVIADFDYMINFVDPSLKDVSCHEERSLRVDKICEMWPGIFEGLPLINGAKESVEMLFEIYEVYFLSTPMWHVPASFTGKRKWIETHFGEAAKKRLILSHRKDLAIGDYLIDDRLKNGAAEFKGEHIHFGTERFPNWDVVYKYLSNP